MEYSGILRTLGIMSQIIGLNDGKFFASAKSNNDYDFTAGNYLTVEKDMTKGNETGLGNL